MWFWVSWSSGERKKRRGRGYFNCPACKSRQPCDQSQVVRNTYLYGFIPTTAGDPVGPDVYRCRTCRKEFVADGVFAYDFGEHAAAPKTTWQCFKCNGDVPYELFDCPHCGYRFDVSRRL